MRRVLLSLLVVSTLGVTSALASSFDVRTDGLTSFQMPATVAVPAPIVGAYALTGEPSSLPGALLRIPEPPATLPDTSTQSKSVEPGGALLTETRSDYYHQWDTPSLDSPLWIASPTAQLFITQTGNDGPVTAGLFDCGTTCTLIAAATASPVGGTVTISFGDFSKMIPTGHRLALRVVNSGTNKYNLQWGFKDNRPARLEFSAPPAPSPAPAP